MITSPLTHLDRVLNNITMYRVVLYGLLATTAASILLSAVGLLPYTPWEMLASLTVLGTSTFIAKELFSRLFHAPTNVESSAITSLILFLIASPSLEIDALLGLFLLGVVAIASKFLFAWKGAHIFNPVAIAAVILGASELSWINWWVGSAVLLPFTGILGAIILRKTRREHMFFVFLVAAIASITAFQNPTLNQPLAFAGELLTAWPLIFFGTVMLTEPLAMPATKKFQLLYAGLIGILMGTPYKIPPFYSTPEMALIIGNLFPFIVVPRWQGTLQFIKKQKIGSDLYHFWFERPSSLEFEAGQYMEWTLPHTQPGTRGNRRYLTIASSPTEKKIGLGIRIPTHPSTFKKALMNLQPGDSIIAAQVAGDFTLPAKQSRNLVFIAGGIGVTPFRSMTQYLIDTHATDGPKTTLFYAYSHPKHFGYQDVFTTAQKQLPFTYIPIITRKDNVPNKWQGEVGYISAAMIQEHVPDWAERTFYLSGPNAMVDSTVEVLNELGVSDSSIITDYFPGY